MIFTRHPTLLEALLLSGLHWNISEQCYQEARREKGEYIIQIKCTPGRLDSEKRHLNSLKIGVIRLLISRVINMQWGLEGALSKSPNQCSVQVPVSMHFDDLLISKLGLITAVT